MDKRTKILRSLGVVAAVGSLAALGVFAAFSSQTSNPDNVVATGTVQIDDNDAGEALYSMANAAPGDSVTRCIQVTYSGSLPADVKIYTGDAIGPLGDEVTLEIEPGSQVEFAADCTDFVADGAALFDGSLASFGTTHSGWGDGLADLPQGETEWTSGDSVVYRVTATLDPEATLQGATTGSHAITWEAQSQ